MENSVQVDPNRATELKDNLLEINQKIQKALAARPSTFKNPQITLIAVSKTKPASDIQALYDLGQRDFGENYVQELAEKIAELPKDINWHFIGKLQSNKVNKVVIPGLSCIQTIDSIKLAGKVDTKVKEKGLEKLDVYVQVNTDDDKSAGIESNADLEALIDFVLNKCDHLSFKGLMTIGAYGDLIVFQKMTDLRKEVAMKFGLEDEEIELSMGMSADFENAVENGATCVRVGSSIFGARNYNK